MWVSDVKRKSGRHVVSWRRTRYRWSFDAVFDGESGGGVECSGLSESDGRDRRGQEVGGNWDGLTVKSAQPKRKKRKKKRKTKDRENKK